MRRERASSWDGIRDEGAACCPGRPAGNITLFVLTPVEKAECAAVAAKLLAIEALKAEQVGVHFS